MGEAQTSAQIFPEKVHIWMRNSAYPALREANFWLLLFGNSNWQGGGLGSEQGADEGSNQSALSRAPKWIATAIYNDGYTRGSPL